MNKFHLTVFGISYIFGIGSTIYLIGQFLNRFLNFDFGQITVLVLQIVAFYSLTKVEEYFKQKGVEEYISQHEKKEN